MYSTKINFKRNFYNERLSPIQMKLCRWTADNLLSHIGRFTLSVAFLLSSMISARATGQAATPGSSVDASASIGRLPSTSDPIAVAIVTSMLDHAGGRAKWASVHSVKLRADVSMSGVSGTHSALLLDDWSTTSTKYRRRLENSPVMPRNHNGVAGFDVKHGSTIVHVPEVDQARALLTHVPFAAAEIILRKPEYVIALPRRRHCPSGSECFDVYRKLGPSGPPMREEEWTISQSTYLPSVIRYLLPTVGAGLMRWKEIDFKQFTNQNGVLLPQEIDVALPGGIKQHWHFSAVIPNATFDTAAFDAEALH